jgi:hypothetical protein
MTDIDVPERTVEVVNESGCAGDVCIFQLLCRPPLPFTSLAWLTRALPPAARTPFTWRETFEFYWRERDAGTRRPASITATQVWPAELQTANDVALTWDRAARAYRFRDRCRGPRAGKLYLRQDRTIPLRRAEVGLGMCGRPAHVAQAQPNLALIVRPDVTYWIAFGRFAEGRALDLDALRGDAAALRFPHRASTLRAVLNRNRTWSIAAQ